MKLETLDFAKMEARQLAQMEDRALSAGDVFSKPLDELTKEQRRALKAINMGIAYGAPPWLIDGIKSGRFKVVANVHDDLIFEEQAPN